MLCSQLLGCHLGMIEADAPGFSTRYVVLFNEVRSLWCLLASVTEGRVRVLWRA